MQQATRTELDQFYTYGDVYETLDTCRQLEMLLGRLKRQHLLSDEEVAHSKDDVSRVRARLEAQINSVNLTPKGPRLP